LGGGEALFPQSSPRDQINIKPGNTGWRFGAGRIATDAAPITGKLVVLRGHPLAITNGLAVTLAVASRWGGLGAKIQHGFGLAEVTLTDQHGKTVVPDIDAFLARHGSAENGDGGLPSLGNFFFARLFFRKDMPDDWWKQVRLGISPTDQARLGLGKTNRDVPIAPAVKYALRFGRTTNDSRGRTQHVSVLKVLGDDPRNAKHKFFLGHVDGNQHRAAMLHVSNAYKERDRWQFRLWGWVPREGLPAGLNRDSLLAELYELVTTNQAFGDGIFGPGLVDLSQTVWRECGVVHSRNRPAPSPSPATCADFVRCLLA
jgi:CRISPR-associated protein Cmr1